jgi:UDP-N-acetylglucosamine diphosphorylase/glucosamine-1-phosphate N-acetyltransferase
VPAGPYHLVNPSDVWVGDEVQLQPGCVLDATRGPVVVSDHAVIGAHAVIQGPCFIGPYCFIRPLSLIRPGTSLGTMCRVGGELSHSILFGYSNKAHDGYLGDSYVGKWANLGAGTNVSNLKNTYGEIHLTVGQRDQLTGRRKLGALIGDHAKTAIGTRLMAGSYVGFCCQLGGSAIAPRFTPSFSFWTDRGSEPYRLDKAIEVTARVFAQRDRPWTPLDEKLLRYVATVAPTLEGA